MAVDYLLDDTGDLLFTGGDLAYGESDPQHIQDTINAYPGWWKEFPADGVGIRSYLNSSGQMQKLAREIKIQLQSDGYAVSPAPTIDTSNGSMTVYPNATRI
ncbi:MAG: oxidase [Sphingobacteriales bacterium]|nr:MAG: oxidase [Sphingobacteriales bacterium]